MVPKPELPHAAQFPAGRQCILVVEDELIIRLLAGEVLRDAGYDVIEASSADEALTVLNSLVRVDLVFSDIRMPGSLDGLDLLALVRETLPALPVIMTTAHLEPERASAIGTIQLLLKPYAIESVLGAVRQELAGVI